MPDAVTPSIDTGADASPACGVPGPSRGRKFAMLGALYFVEGLPWGFQSKALPVYLRAAGTSLTVIGLLSVLSLPWMTKVLWAPLIDRYGSARFGRRKSWIVPLQATLALICVAAAVAARSMNIAWLLSLVFCMNLCAATMDIAVDGLAVDLLSADELGPGNTAQVVGYKLGALTSGGVLVAANATLGWSGLFLSAAGLVTVVSVATILFREPRREAQVRHTQSIGSILALLGAQVRRPGAIAFFLFIATYKTGEQLVDGMFKPFLIDSGFTPAQVGFWASTIGMGASLAGSLVGGLAASRYPLLPALAVAAALRVLPVTGVAWLTTTHPSLPTIVTVSLAEDFCGGVLTTIMFAYMMSRTDRRIGATHFTLLATIEMIGKAPVPLVAGLIAQRHGYTVTFGLGAVLSLLYLGLLIPLRRSHALHVAD